jgi:hypothetical protein
MGFEAARKKQLPTYVGNATGQAYQGALGALDDAELDVLKDGIDARLPIYAPHDAYPLLGADRGLLRAPIENEQAYVARLEQAHDIRYWDGTKPAIQQILAPYGITAAQCIVHDNCDGDWDGNREWFSRFFVLVDVTTNGYFATDGNWNDNGTYDDGGLWDSTISQADARYWRRSIRGLKAPASYPVVLAFVKVFGDGLWDSIGSYDDGGNWDDANAPTVFFITIGHVWGEELWLGGDDGNWDAPEIWQDFEEP